MDSNQSPQEDRSKIYVGNLPFSMDKAAVEELCAPYGSFGEEGVNLVADRETGRSRGFAFVQFQDEDAASAAIEALDGMEVEGRKLFVKVARPKQPRRDGDRRGGFRRRGGDYRNDR